MDEVPNGCIGEDATEKLDTLLKIPFLNKIVAKKIRNGLGINNARLWASGSAPLAPAVIEWFAKSVLISQKGGV